MVMVTGYWSQQGEVRLYHIDPHYVVMMYQPEEQRWKELLCCGLVHASEVFDWCVDKMVEKSC